jgi:hypothetical protein
MNELKTRLIHDTKNKSSDIFQTPKDAVDVLAPFLPKKQIIWESAAGLYLLAKHLSGYGHTVYTSDILTGQDFFNYEPEINWDIQITNPPYSIKDDWLERSYKLGKPFALLLPINSLHSVRRCDLFRQFGIQLIIPPKRINFITPSGEGTGAWFPVAWFCYGLGLEHDLTFAGGADEI